MKRIVFNLLAIFGLYIVISVMWDLAFRWLNNEIVMPNRGLNLLAAGLAFIAILVLLIQIVKCVINIINIIRSRKSDSDK